MKNMEALVRKLVEETMAQQAMCKELVGVLTAGHVGRPAGVAIPCPGSQQVKLSGGFETCSRTHRWWCFGKHYPSADAAVDICGML
ncbi:unnamed protein product [Arctogadus glacialis]